VTSYLTHLECSACGKTFDADTLHNVCPACGKVLLPRYDLDAAGSDLTRETLAGRPSTLWRYAEVLPVRDPGNVVSLGEGWTPLLPANRLGRALGCDRLLVKDEGLNPTGSFKARGMAVAVARAKELGATSLATPSAGNAGSAMSAYAARAGLPSNVFMPVDAPIVNQALCVAYGANLYLVRGLIGDCGRIVRREGPTHGWFDMSTLREPYRVEGKKTMGYELAEQLGWRLPGVIIYPTGGGTGIVGMWKAFDEMEAMGWIDSRRPRMVSVQASGCAPIVRAFAANQDHAEPWHDAHTIAAGLRVPAAIGDYLILDAIRRSHGTAIAVDDAAIREEMPVVAKTEGFFVSTEAAATVAGLRLLLANGAIDRDEEIVLFLTGSGLLNADEIRVDRPVIDPDDVEGFARAAAGDYNDRQAHPF
jgi:threonine synthase